jgi:hypothetical protein
VSIVWTPFDPQFGGSNQSMIIILLLLQQKQSFNRFTFAFKNQKQNIIINLHLVKKT